MTRLLKSLLAVATLGALGVAPSSCQTGGIGDPCIPEDEFNASFSGFKVTQENIESRSFQCESRICLVNSFQGRVTCPLGQAFDTNARYCGGPDGTCAGDGEECMEAGAFAPDCEKSDECGEGRTCNKKGKFCECRDNADCPQDAGYICDGDSKQCKQYVCHKPGNCQDANQTAAQNEGKDCCVPGTDTPVAQKVCGQCEDKGGRSAARAVYCSCRCGVAEGQAEDENFNFCDCPDGFVCTEVRPDVGLGDPQLAGKYCVKSDDPIIKAEKIDVAEAPLACGSVAGYLDGDCAGTFSSAN
jgi:hypothetical protein